MKRAACVLVVMFLASGVAFGKEFKSKAGYSLQYPDNWTLQENPNTSEATRELRQHGVQLPSADGTDISCMITSPPLDGELAANVAIGTVAGRFGAINQAALDEYRKGVENGLAKSGMTVRQVEGRLCKVAGRDAIRVSFVNRIANIPELRQTQYVVRGSGKLHIFTMTAPVGQESKVEKDFASILNSIKIEGGGLDWLGDNAGKAGGLFAAVVVFGVVALVQRSRRRKAAAQAAGLPGAVAGADAWPVPTAPAASVASEPVEPEMTSTAVGDPLPSDPPAYPADEQFAAEQQYPAEPPMPSEPAAPTQVDAPQADQPVVVACPGCGRQLRARSSLSGRACRCPKCGTTIVVP